MQDEIERFITQGTASGWQESTVANYRFFLAGAIEFLCKRGCRRLADVSSDDLSAFMAHLVTEQYAKNTRMRIAILLRRFFAWLQEEGRCIANPAKGLPIPDDGEQDLPEPPLSEEEVAAIIDGLPRASVFDLRQVCLIELLYGCGLRISEAINLNLKDIDLVRKTVLIKASKHEQTRVVPLPNTAKAALQAYLSLRRTLLVGPDKGALFITQQGTRIKNATIYGFFTLLNAKRWPDGSHLHPHIFRHSIAVHLLRRGADIRYIQQFLGHSCLDTTKIYLRLVPGHLKEDYEKAMPEIGGNNLRSGNGFP